MDCDRFAEVAAELALGVLTGRERAEAIQQLDRCDGCREQVRRLAVTGEQLLGLLPAVTPPPGLERRILSELTPPAPSARPGRTGRTDGAGRHRRPARNRLLLTAAAATVVALGCGLGGWALNTRAPGGGAAEATGLRSATLATAAHHTIGQVFLKEDGDGDGWLYVSVDAGPATRKVICQLLGRDGQVVTIGSFGLRGGYGYWGSPESMRGTAVASARLLGADGHVLGSATFGS